MRCGKGCGMISTLLATYVVDNFFLHFQGAIAKKPYNPILGEVFRCYWDLPGQDKAASEEAGKVSD